MKFLTILLLVLSPLFGTITTINKEELKSSLYSFKNTFMSKKYFINYYKYNEYEPLWISEDGSFTNLKKELISQIENDFLFKNNLNKFKNYNKFKELINNLNYEDDDYKQKLLEIDFLLSDIYHQYMTYLQKGAINWKDFKQKLKEIEEEKDIQLAWDKYTSRKNFRKLLYKAKKENSLENIISKVDSSYYQYNKLKESLKTYESKFLNKDFTKLNSKKTLRKDDVSQNVLLLKQRLIEEEYLKEVPCTNFFKNEKEINCNEYFDEDLTEAVKLFQKDHGLYADGLVGKKTIKTLNISANKKIAKIKLNLERMRWMPRTLGEKHLIVNIPNYKLHLYENGELSFKTNIVVGEKKYPSPIFSNRIKFIVLNPYWRIPQSIVKKEIIPKILKNPNYLEGKGIRVHESWEEDSMTYDLKQIDWSYYTKKSKEEDLDLPLKFIQIPNNKNPLGRIKFMFPNKYSVYLHDSPAKNLFNRSKRAFSHGCIRVQEPKKLLKKIYSYEENLDFTKAKETLKDINKEKVDLENKIPVHLVYLTSWVNEDNRIQFREDIYNYDSIQLSIFKKNKFKL